MGTDRTEGEYRTLRVTEEGAVALVTLNRPEVLNAIDEQLLGELEAVVRRIDGDGRTRVAILVGEGSRAFSAGGDIARMAEMSTEDGLKYRLRAHGLLHAIESSAVVFLAALNGLALGGGCELALACDLRVASASAQLGLPELSVGLIPGWGGMQRLARLVGATIAKDMVFTARRLTAEEALQRGVVSRVVAEDGLLDECRRVAERIVQMSPVAVRQAKRSITLGTEMPLAYALAYDVESASVNFACPDRVEGLRAFLEKRAPVFGRRTES